MEAEIYGLFPTAVGRYKLGRDFTNKELKFIREQKTAPNMGNLTSKDRYVFKHKTLNKINKFSEHCVDHYFKNVICPKHPVSLRITQSWLNYTKKGEYHHNHRHPNSIISGVLYIEADEVKDRIYFTSPILSSNTEFATDNLNGFNSKEWWMPAKTGELILFPSTLFHAVPPTETESRISLSFNTFPVGYVGNEENLTALHL